MRNRLTSRHYNEFAVTLSVGAAGLAAVQEAIESLRETPEHVLGNVMLGGLSGALETLAAYQYVRAWGPDYFSAHEDAAWALYASLWRLSAALRPDLDPEPRATLVESLLAPLRDPALPNSVRAAIAVRLFQVLLAILLLPLRDAQPDVQLPLQAER